LLAVHFSSSPDEFEKSEEIDESSSSWSLFAVTTFYLELNFEDLPTGSYSFGI
jgi:hypothetical protein